MSSPLLNRIIELAAHRTGQEVREVSPQQSLDDLGADSLDVAEFAMDLEDLLGLSFADEEHQRLMETPLITLSQDLAP